METNANFISDERIEEALDWLRDNADAAAKATAERKYIEEYRKTIKAQLMAEHNDKAGVIQERNAYADSRYAEHLEAIKEAVYQDEKIRNRREAELATIEAWRSLSANYRAMKI